MERSLNNQGSLLLEMCLTIALFTFIISFTSLSLSTLMSSSNRIQKLRESLFSSKEQMDTAIIKLTKIPKGIPPSGIIIKNLTPCQSLISNDNFKTIIIDPHYSQAIDYDCGGTPLFQNEFATTQETSPLGSTTSFDIVSGFAFITASSSLPNQPTFYIADTHGDFPTIISHVTSIQGGNVVDATHSYAFVAAQGTTNQLQIIDIHDKYNPKIVSQMSLPGVTGSYPSATSIFYYNSKIYIGTHRTAGREFHIFDVSHPEKPVWLGSIEVNHNINDIIVRDNYAYLATSGNTKDIIILDISDPSHITMKGSASFLGSEDTTSLYLLGSILYAGRLKSSQTTHPELVMVSVKDPLQLYEVGTLHLDSKVNALTVNNTYIFSALSGTKSGLYTFSMNGITSATSTPIKVSKTPIIDIDNEGKTLYSLSQDGVLSVYK